VHGRHRLGDGAQLHRLRPARNGATVVMYEGAPNFPENDRFWQIIEKYRSISSTRRRRRSARSSSGATSGPPEARPVEPAALGTVGEPINPEAWMWYHKVIGGERCPIVDTWWQTETGAIMISPLPGATATKPGSGDASAAGRRAEVVDEGGKPVAPIRAAFGDAAALAVDAAHDLRRSTTATNNSISARSRAATSPATARGATRTAITGSWAASTTC
jgi:acyl-coenzyme A synthetase/AMP-(fatty) acid ligase